MEWKQGEEVMIHSVDGTGNEYKGKIAGIAVELPEMKCMIVELIDKFRGVDYPYSHISVSEHCLKLIH